jgi:hypothetical protein
MDAAGSSETSAEQPTCRQSENPYMGSTLEDLKKL